MIEEFLHTAFDITYVFRYIFDNLGTLLGNIFTPLTWIFNLVKGFFNSAFVDPTPPVIAWTIPDNVMAVFNAIPYWSTFTGALGAGIAILVLVFILRKIIHL